MKITLLKGEQIWGFKALQVIKDYGRKTSLTDLAIVLSAAILGKPSKMTSEGDRAGFVWTASPLTRFGGHVLTVDFSGWKYFNRPSARCTGVRPAISPSETNRIHIDDMRLLTTRKKKVLQTVFFGEYPQIIAPDNMQIILENTYKNKMLNMTGKNYTYDYKIDYETDFIQKKYSEYELEGEKYIRTEVIFSDDDSILSNGKKVNIGDICWIEVRPIEWLVDKSGWWISKKALFTRVQFDTSEYYDGDFEKTNMKKYLDDYFSIEMFSYTPETGKNRT